MFHCIRVLENLGNVTVVGCTGASWQMAQKSCFENNMFPSSVRKINYTLQYNKSTYKNQYWTGVMREFTIVRAQGRQ